MNSFKPEYFGSTDLDNNPYFRRKHPMERCCLNEFLFLFQDLLYICQRSIDPKCKNEQFSVDARDQTQE